MVGGTTVSTMFLIAAALLGRVTQWEHFPHYGGGNCIMIQDDLVLAGTSGGILFSHYSSQEDKLIADSGWTSPEMLTHDRVSHLTLDQQGNLWVSLSGGGIDVFSPQGEKTHFNQIDGLPLNLGINQTIPDSVVYAATTQGLCIREYGYFDIWDSYETGGGLPSDNVNCMISSDSGLYVGTTAGLTFLPVSASPEDPSSWQQQSIDQVSIIALEWQGDTLWAASADQLFRKSPGSSWAEDPTFPFGSIASMAAGEGGLAVGCTNRCYILQNDQWVLYQGNLNGDALTGITWQGDRLLGVLANTYSDNRSSGSGVTLLLSDSTWRRTFPDMGPVSNDLRASTILSDGSFWVTSNANGASVYSNMEWTNLNQELLFVSQCYAVCPAGNGVFISSIGHGIDWLEWNGSEVTSTLHFTSDDGLINDRVFNAAAGSSSSTWFAHRTLYDTEPSGVSLLSWSPGDPSGAFFTVITDSEGLPSKEVNCVLPSGSRYAWAGTDEGLVWLDGDRQMILETYNAQSGLPSSTVTSLAVNRSGTVFVGTAAGLAKVSDDVLTEVDAIGESIEALVCDELGSVWVSTSDGLKRYFESTGTVEEYTSFNSVLPVCTIYAMSVNSDDGEIWLSTDHGLWRGELETALSGDGSDARVYPDPFIPGRGEVLGIAGIPDEPSEIKVYSLTGSLVFEYSSSGRDDFAWDGNTSDGETVASGIYMLLVTQGDLEPLHLKFALVR